MARLQLGQKVDRVTSFMLGLRNPRAAEILMAHGFGQDDLDQGWTLLRTVVGDKLALPMTDRPPDPRLLVELDAWENKWFPIAKASLSARYPEVEAEVFANLSQTRGAEVVLSVDTFVRRVQALAEGDGNRPAARELLAKRGLTGETIESAEQLIAQLSQIKESAPRLEDAEASREARLEADEDLWAWYREWSTIARVAITDGRLLRQLGFLRKASSASAEAEDEAEDEDLQTEEQGAGAAAAAAQQ